ncbi:MAG: hypothetical protein OXI01_00665 [Albidovulum sp.]|nr:hypothetical protein [Albidovulum sp.]
MEWIRRTSPYRAHVAANDWVDPLGPTLAIFEWPLLAGLAASVLEIPVLKVKENPMIRRNFNFFGGDV